MRPDALIEVYRLEPLIGIEAWFRRTRPRAIILRPYAFIVVEEASTSKCRNRLYLLAKKCIDSIHAARALSPGSTIAGLKDAHAVTLQYVASNARLSYIERRDYTIIVAEDNVCVKRGGVVRNNFSITMLIIGEDAVASGRVASTVFRAPNYYGFQRFGIQRPNTHILGLWLLAGTPGRLIREMLQMIYPFQHQQSLGDYEYVLKKRLETKKSLSIVPRSLPHHIVELGVNAFQAYLFNRILSRLVEYMGETLCEKYARILVPGCGFDYASVANELRAVYDEVFSEEGVTPSMFCSLRRYGVRADAYPRETCISTRARIYAWDDTRDEGDAHDNKTLRLVTIAFSLPRGAYATTLLAEYYRLLEPNTHLLPC